MHLAVDIYSFLLNIQTSNKRYFPKNPLNFLSDAMTGDFIIRNDENIKVKSIIVMSLVLLW